MRSHLTHHPRISLSFAAIGLLLLTACGEAATPADAGGGDLILSCEPGVADCVDNPDAAAADCEDGVECNDTSNGDPFAMCEAGVPDCNDTPDEPSGDCPTCDPDAEGEPSTVSDERMNPSITIVQAFAVTTPIVEQAPGTITSPLRIYLQEAVVDGRSITVSFSGGEAPCFVVDHAELTEEADAVYITVWAGPADGAGDCSTMSTSMQAVTVTLDADLGSRALLDGGRTQGADNI